MTTQHWNTPRSLQACFSQGVRILTKIPCVSPESSMGQPKGNKKGSTSKQEKPQPLHTVATGEK